MSGPDIFVSLAYALYVAAPAIRDELWLRVTLFANSVAFAIWGLWIQTSPVIVANVLFALVSLRQIIRVWRERRPVELDPDAEQVFTEVFHRMGRREFAQLWESGREVANPGVVTRIGEPVTELWVLLEGAAEVTLASGERLTRPAPSVIGEVSALSDTSLATATVVIQNGRLRRWHRHELNTLFEAEPEVEAQTLRGLSRTLANRMAEREIALWGKSGPTPGPSTA